MFSMGLATHQISVDDLFVGNRQRLVAKLQQNGDDKDTAVFLRGGPSQERFDSDHEPLFRQVCFVQGKDVPQRKQDGFLTVY